MIPTWLADADPGDEDAADAAFAEWRDLPATHRCPQCGTKCRCLQGSDLESECTHDCG
jgi:rubredoxin